ncbi:ABC transporter permease [Paenibacillus sp. 5J-6]|uniref:Transport permease protein n=1 Tax=Paenibacillus silvestris TaxID=2606219 RepID=A0A6L8V2G6_9BACL|nr:ABC transporter permease [Paenibacillus silvestris]MZQ83736.1 ABC transporter permease [Paenibacillus silvestris]
MKEILFFFKDLFNNRLLVWDLSKKDFQNKFTGSYLGIIWAFIQPFIMILIYWFVFQVGFKSTSVSDVPFVIWLLSGMIPWIYFTDSVFNSTNSIVESSYLVKKIVFNVRILPLVKVISAAYIHLFFIIVLLAMLFIYGFSFNLAYLQIFYYFIALFLLVLGIGLISSSLIVFIKDIGQIISMLLQFGFWLTPIFWSMQQIPEQYQFLLKLNPMYYIANGYRETFLTHVYFWEHPVLTLYFWVVVLVFLSAGIILFSKLRSHFADVL